MPVPPPSRKKQTDGGGKNIMKSFINPSNAFGRLVRNAVLSRLRALVHGELTLIDGEEKYVFGKMTEAFPVKAILCVHDPRFYILTAFGGSIGSGEAYMNGYWTVDALTSLARIFVRNREVLDGMEKGWAYLTAPLQKLYHRLRGNTKKGSRENIAAHYDLGNDFYALFLDPMMMYSCAIFEDGTNTLEEASLEKLERICKKLGLSPADHLLEIGTGWGGLAIHAAKRYGCRVTTTTISRKQYGFAREWIRKEGLENQITVLLEDYRDLKGQYDKLVSVEMIEAVGHAYYNTYFRSCSKLLKPDGEMLLQAIVISDRHYETAKRSVDFIQRYIFPGSCIPSIAAISSSVASETDMRLFHLEDITPHYATTLRLWRERFFANIDKVRALGYPESFIRMWEFYLGYCEGGFLERFIGDVQMIFAKPLSRKRPILPALESPAVL